MRYAICMLEMVLTTNTEVADIFLMLSSGLADQSVGSDGNEPQEEQLLGWFELQAVTHTDYEFKDIPEWETIMPPPPPLKRDQ